MAVARLALVLLCLAPVAAQVCQNQAPHQCACKTADDVIDLSPLAEDIMDRFGKVGWQTDSLDYYCYGQDITLCLRLKGCLQTRGDVRQNPFPRVAMEQIANPLRSMASPGEAHPVRTILELNVTPDSVKVDRHEKSQQEVTKLRLGCTPVPGDQVPPQHGLWVQGRLSDRSCSLLKRLYPSGNGHAVESITVPPPSNASNYTFPTLPSPGVVTATATSPTIALLLLSTEVVLTALILVTISGIALCAVGMRRMKRRHFHRHASCHNDPPPYVMYEKVPITD